MKKIALNSAKQSTTMFLSAPDIEAKYKKLVNSQIAELIDKISQLNKKDGFVKFVREDKSAIDDLITLLGVSEEKFKRVISWIRIKRGYVFDAEWSSSAIRQKMLQDNKIMDLIFELITEGYRSPTLTSVIPSFILDDFRLDLSRLTLLKNRDYVCHLIKSSLSTKYNSEYCTYYDNIVGKKIREIANHTRSLYEPNSVIPNTPFTGVAYIEMGGKYIIINSKFYLTTSSSQTRYAEHLQNISATAQSYANIIVINMLDGAGWIGRSADYNKIYYACKYFLNLNNIGQLENIVNELNQ